MPDSVLYTAQVPSFDTATGQLTLEQHHLVSTPLSYLSSLPETVLLLSSPPAKPYQQEQEETSDQLEGEPDVRPRRKRRRVAPSAEAASPADWRLKREKDERRTTTDRDTDEHHASILLPLETAIDAVRGGWSATREEGKGWMGELEGRVAWGSPVPKEDREELNLVQLAERYPVKEEGVLRLAVPSSGHTLDRIFGRIVLNLSTSSSCTLDITEASAERDPEKLASLLIPPSSGFLLADFTSWSSPSSGIASLGRETGGWDVVVVDPPWPNASATRSSSYDTFDAYDLWKLDLPGLLGESPALIAVWVTNKVKFRRLLIDKLLPAWHIRNAAEWYWVKIASETGEPVWRLDAKHRRCYEGLVLGYYVPPKAKVDLPTLPPNKVFLSTPMGHSRKPILIDLLRPFLLQPSKPPNVLELFARTTLSGPLPSASDGAVELSGGSGEEAGRKRRTFLAVGNEAIKFNVLDGGENGVKGWLRGI
ncbi:hypothetical protein JCM11251_004828 [Rhodosporidiobolus azoricus]